VTLEFDKVRERLQEHNISLSVSEDALFELVELGYDPDFGARPLRRVIQNRVEDNISEELLAHHFEPGDCILVDIEEVDGERKFVLTKDTSEEPEVEDILTSA
jgi:ATP-dependent Clp protease ATP-binding subunit ClpA